MWVTMRRRGLTFDRVSSQRGRLGYETWSRRGQPLAKKQPLLVSDVLQPEPLEQIADWYELTLEQVRAAIAFEESRKRRPAAA